MPILFFCALDPSLGRLNYESLSDQVLMEMLIDGMSEDEKEWYQDDNGNFLDVCQWNAGLGEFKCANDRVSRIRFEGSEFSEKQFPFEFTPPLVTHFEIIGCSIHGTLNTLYLPRTLIVFEANLTELHGSLNFSALPDTLVTFDVHENNFSGEVNLNNLPVALENLDVSHNNLSGSIDIERLPPSLATVDLSSNGFTGDFRLLSFPQTLLTLIIMNCPLSGTAVLRKASGEMPFVIENFDFTKVVDEDGEVHAWERDIVEEYHFKK